MYLFKELVWFFGVSKEGIIVERRLEVAVVVRVNVAISSENKNVYRRRESIV